MAGDRGDCCGCSDDSYEYLQGGDKKGKKRLMNNAENEERPTGLIEVLDLHRRVIFIAIGTKLTGIYLLRHQSFRL